MTERPVDLNLFAVKFPITAIASILHRIAGIALFLGLPILIWIWGWSLQSAASFEAVAGLFRQPVISVLSWFYGSCLVYHILAGIKHLLMDLGIGEELSAAKRLSWGVLLTSILVSLFIFYLLMVR